ncbi:MAG TPA: T9SS type A sorting domain-containing protein [Cyclobacteriaceae bacterium]|nr:T9SS type A sorting domain-containing protein [Cyclobacteriaceae bacterium]
MATFSGIRRKNWLDPGHSEKIASQNWNDTTFKCGNLTEFKVWPVGTALAYMHGTARDQMRNLNAFLLTFFVAMALSSTGSAVMAGPSEDQGLTFIGKEKDLFVLKAAKGSDDAKVEIFSDAGELVTAQTIQQRKIIIDFGGVAFGTYTIKVTQGDSVREFRYVKK